MPVAVPHVMSSAASGKAHGSFGANGDIGYGREHSPNELTLLQWTPAQLSVSLLITSSVSQPHLVTDTGCIWPPAILFILLLTSCAVILYKLLYAAADRAGSQERSFVSCHAQRP